MIEYTFTLKGKIKPYVRMTRRSKWVDPNAQEYLASQEAIGHQLKQQMSASGWEMLPAKTPLSVELSIGTDKLHASDIDNCLKAVLDSANKIVFPDDCWIDNVIVDRYLTREHLATFTIWIR